MPRGKKGQASTMFVDSQEQKQMLGERLYPRIRSMHPKLAGTIIGILLEADNSELLSMLENPECLKAKVEEAVAVVQARQAKQEACGVPGQPSIPTIPDKIAREVGCGHQKVRSAEANECKSNIHNHWQPGIPQQMPAHCAQAVHVQGQAPITSSMLAEANLQEQKQMLGERLFPLIQSMHPELAGKITGMMLEIDNAELLHMLESGESLKAKVVEAIAVLQAHQAKESASGIRDERKQGQVRPATTACAASPPPGPRPYMYNFHSYRQPGLPQQQMPAQAGHVQGQAAMTSSMLVESNLQEQKQMLGERLFPLIQSMHPELAGKITGMLLEIDNAELLHMLGSHESLKAKVEEAIAVLLAREVKEAESGVPTKP